MIEIAAAVVPTSSSERRVTVSRLSVFSFIAKAFTRDVILGSVSEGPIRSVLKRSSHGSHGLAGTTSAGEWLRPTRASSDFLLRTGDLHDQSVDTQQDVLPASWVIKCARLQLMLLQRLRAIQMLVATEELLSNWHDHVSWRANG
jgi:hypothetical protein